MAINNTISQRAYFNRLFSLLSLQKSFGYIIILLPALLVNFSGLVAQTPLPNPDLVPACPYNIIFVLDESGSIVSSVDDVSIVSEVRNGARDLINALRGTGSRVIVVEFNTNARIAVIGGLTTYQTISNAYVTAFNNYISADANNTPSASSYDPEDYSCQSGQCYTNWEGAFNQVQNINASLGTADLVIFFTDGMPTAYINAGGNVTYGTTGAITGQALAEATDAANAVKQQGSHIFVVGIPNPTLPESNIRQISGPDKYPYPESDFTKGDYSVSTSSTLQQDLSGIASVVCIVDLRLVKTASTYTACTGDTVNFLLTLYNEGVDKGSGIVVQDVIPSGYTYISDNGGNTTNTTGGVLTWNIADLNPGASVSLQISAIANPTGQYRNTAQVIECPQTDVDSSPNNDDGDQSEDDEAFAIVSVVSPQICSDGDPCTIDQCYNGQCLHTLMNCNDANPCTVDECVGDTCSHIFESYNTTIQVTICDNEQYFAGGALQNTTGTYIDTFYAGSGCDSIRTTLLTVLPTSRSLVRIPICQGDSIYLAGYYRKQAGAYNDTFTAHNGCDSIFTTVVVIPNCDDNYPCTEDFCINGSCANLPKDCDDNNSCTLDTCVNGNCINSQVNCELTISGFILSEPGDGISNAVVHLTGTSDSSVITGTDGYYSFNVMPGGSYTITPNKNNDIQVSNGITTLDIALISRHILSLQLLSSPYKVIAADVNGSGSLTTIDAAIMTSFVLGNTNSFPNGRLWEFVSGDYVFPDPLHPFPFDNTRTFNNITQTLSNQNFIGIKLGDVNNSWDPNIP